MLRKIFISADIPRDISTFNGSFSEGLLFTRVFGYLFFILGLVLCLICLFKYKYYFLGMFCLSLCIFGMYLIHYTNALPKERQKIFTNGTMVRAKITGHRSRFNPLKLSKEYILDLEVLDNQEKVSVSHTMKNLHKSAPIGSETEGIRHEGSYFFGESIGGQLDTHRIENKQ